MERYGLGSAQPSVLCDVNSVMTEFMVSEEEMGRFGVVFSVWMPFAVLTGKRSNHPKGMALITHMAALQAEQRRETQRHLRE